MKFSPRAVLATAVCVPGIFLSIGCAKPTIVGKWQGAMDAPMVGKIDANLEYKADGTMTQTANSKMGQIYMTGTYKTEAENLSVTVTDIKVGNNSVMGLLPPQAKANLSNTAPYKLEGDTLTITRNGQSQTFTRVKG